MIYFLLWYLYLIFSFIFCALIIYICSVFDVTDIDPCQVQLFTSSWDVFLNGFLEIESHKPLRPKDHTHQAAFAPFTPPSPLFSSPFLPLSPPPFQCVPTTHRREACSPQRVHSTLSDVYTTHCDVCPALGDVCTCPGGDVTAPCDHVSGGTGDGSHEGLMEIVSLCVNVNAFKIQLKRLFKTALDKVWVNLFL